MARPPRRPDRPAGYLARPARLGAAALHRVARVVQRAAEALAPAAPSAAAAPPPEPPPRRPGQPPEHWLSMVRDNAPELLIGRDRTAAERPTLPGYAPPLPVPPHHRSASDQTPIAAAVPTASSSDGRPVGPATTTASSTDAVGGSRALPAHVADADRSGPTDSRSSGIHIGQSTDRMPPAKPLARWAGAVWDRLSGKARTDTPPVDSAVIGGRTESAVPTLHLTPPKTPDPFPAWSWIGPSENDQTRPANRTSAAEWPSLPALHTTTTADRARPARRATGDYAPMEDHVIPWPDLPDDAPLWTVPTTGYPAERLARLEREQAGG